MTDRIAGHPFIETIGGRRCSICDKRWTEIMGATEEAIGQDHWAHTGKLNSTEYNEIQAERDRLWDLVMSAASAGVASDGH